ncbi:MAG: glycosyltransferase family 2 protein [Synergistaceae bacterium]|nr:glycosyltransferase family 2 protein [Synergistaceae bacterium]MBQ9628667.1 glycosyltransferase family 2 protein [Synergistaceae bacterium]MBR0251680.1 glycosyltransferase family 2 protein [Synergistaceae bacterium]
MQELTVYNTHNSQITAHTPSLYIIIPAYNESINISHIIEEWYPVIESHNANDSSRLVVIDDGSKDNTLSILKDLSRTHKLLHVIAKENGGHGSAVLAGYRYAIENKADYIFQTDSDGQTLASEFESFWELRNDYDAVIGTRPSRGDGASRKFVEKVLCFILRIIFGVKVPDANAPFRLIKRELVAKYITKLPNDFNLPNAMLTTYFAYFHERIAFREITFRPRQGGVNSINIRKIITIGIKAVKDFMQFRKNMKRIQEA